MKLKTRIDGTAGDYLLFMDGDSDLSGDDQLEHDAAAAHALMLSLHQLDAGPRKWVEDGASELMREWGFDSWEVE